MEDGDRRIELEPVPRRPRMVRRATRYVLSAPPGTPPLTQEQANRILEEVRDERFTTSAFPRR